MAEAQFPRPFGRYTLRAELGRGGMGVVFRAWDPTARREVALKVCTPGSASVEEVARFLREARLLATLEHPSLVSFVDAGEVDGVAYLAMELIQGETLAQRLERVKRLQPEEAVRVIAQVAHATGELHRNGVVHRDLKPANVLLDGAGTPRVADLGLARGPALESLTQSGVILGTPTYLAPEQIDGAHVGPATDVYALGVLLFRALSGRLPFEDHETIALLQAHLRRAPPRLRTLVPALSSELDAIVGCCLEKSPGDRFAHAGLLADELDALTLPSSAPALRREGRLLVVGLILAVSSASLAAWVALGSRTPGPGEAPAASASDAARDLDALLAEGEAELKRHRLLEAGRAFEEASTLDPTCAAAWGGLARVASRCSMRESALRHARRALDLDPTLLPALLGLGTLVLREGDLVSAEEFLARAERAKVDGEPFAHDVELFRVLVLRARGESAEALACAQRAVERAPDLGRAWLTLAEVHTRAQRHKEAALALERGLQRDPTPLLYAFRQLARLNATQGEGERLRWLNEALDAFPDHPAVLNAAILQLPDLGEGRRAEVLLGRGLTLYPDSPQLRNTRALRLLAQGDALRAARDLEVARRELRDPVVLHTSCKVEFARGRERAALEFAQELARMSPRDVGVQELALKAGVKAGNWQAAREAADRCWALREDPASLTHLLNLSVLAEDFADARAWAREGLSRSPGDPAFSFALLGMRLLQGEAEALEEIQAAAEAPGGPLALNACVLLARYQLEVRGDPSAAWPWIERGLVLRPEEPVLMRLKGDHDLELGELRAANEAYEAVLLEEPSSGEALAGLAESLLRLGAQRGARFTLQLAVHALTRSRRVPWRLRRLQALQAELGDEELLDLELEEDALVEEGESSLQAGDSLRAEAAFRAALLRASGCARAWLGLARVNAGRPRDEAAQAQVLRALEWSPGHPRALAIGTIVARRRGNGELAARLQRELEAQGQGPWLALVRADLARSAGQLATAVGELRAASAAAPDELSFVQGVVMLLVDEGRGQDALEFLQGPLERGLRPQLLTEVALALTVEGDPERTRRAFEEALGAYPHSAWTLRLYADFASSQGQVAEAIHALRRVVRLDPMLGQAWTQLVQLELEAGELEAVDRDLLLQLAAARRGERPLILQRLAKLGYQRNRWPRRTRAWAEQLCALLPDSAGAQRQLWVILLRAGDEEAAAGVAEEVLRLAPTDRSALNDRLRAARNAGDFERAANLSQRLLRAHPQDWNGYQGRGMLRLALADTHGAWADFVRATELDPAAAEPREALLALGVTLGRWAEVREHARAMLRIDSLSQRQREHARQTLDHAERELAR